MDSKTVDSFVDLAIFCLSRLNEIPKEQYLLVRFYDNPIGHTREIATKLSQMKIGLFFRNNPIPDEKLSKDIINYFKTIWRDDANEETIVFNFKGIIFPSVFYHYLKATDSLVFNRGEFEKILDKFIVAWESQTHRYTVVPLVNFSMDCEEISLINGYRVLPFSLEKKTLFWETLSWSNFISIECYETSRFIITVNQLDGAQGGISDVLTCLRLLKKEILLLSVL